MRAATAVSGGQLDMRQGAAVVELVDMLSSNSQGVSDS